MTRKYIYIFISFLLFSILVVENCFAGFFYFEPALGYNQGHYNLYKASGVGIGVKGGFRWGRFYNGVDVGYHPLSISAVPPASGQSYDGKEMDLAGFVGMDYRTFRVWFAYIFDAALGWTVGEDETALSGSGYKLGLGVNIMGKISMNLETRFIKYKDKDVAGTASVVDDFMDVTFLSISWIY